MARTAVDNSGPLSSPTAEDVAKLRAKPARASTIVGTYWQAVTPNTLAYQYLFRPPDRRARNESQRGRELRYWPYARSVQWIIPTVMRPQPEAHEKHRRCAFPRWRTMLTEAESQDPDN